ncbi:MAG: TIGR00725 family protein [Pseudomonadota bacterium]
MAEAPTGKRPLIAVCGAGTADPDLNAAAYETGRLLARAGAVLICGGLGGIMAAAARGARDGGGLTIGLLPGDKHSDANPYIDLPLPTGLGHARNAVIARSAQAMIALPGGPGTLSEVALGLKMGRPVIGLGAWFDIRGVRPAATPETAVALALESWRGLNDDII